MPLRQPPTTILVVCTRRIGDVVVATPVMRSLKIKWPDVEIHVLVFEGTERALQNNRDVDRIVVVKRRTTRKERLIEVFSLWRKYDLAYSVTQSDRASFYCWVGGRYRAGIVAPGLKNLAKRTLFHQCATALPNEHMINVALAGLPSLGVEPVRQVVPPSMGADPSGVAEMKEMLKPLGDEPFVVLQLDAMYRYKAWHATGWIELLAWLRGRGYGVVLSGGAAAVQNADVAAVTHAAGSGTVNLVGRVSLAQLATVISRAALYVGVDTGVSHIAAATGTPTVVLFGPSDPIAWGPWPAFRRQQESPWALRGSRCIGNVFLLQGPGACVPCKQEGCERHQQSPSACLSLLSVRTVIAAAESMLSTHDVASRHAVDDALDSGKRATLLGSPTALRLGSERPEIRILKVRQVPAEGSARISSRAEKSRPGDTAN
jgi:heptosyltransferase-3